MCRVVSCAWGTLVCDLSLVWACVLSVIVGTLHWCICGYGVCLCVVHLHGCQSACVYLLMWLLVACHSRAIVTCALITDVMVCPCTCYDQLTVCICACVHDVHWCVCVCDMPSRVCQCVWWLYVSYWHVFVLPIDMHANVMCIQVCLWYCYPVVQWICMCMRQLSHATCYPGACVSMCC